MYTLRNDAIFVLSLIVKIVRMKPDLDPNYCDYMRLIAVVLLVVCTIFGEDFKSVDYKSIKVKFVLDSFNKKETSSSKMLPLVNSKVDALK